eukprot:277165_1
MDTIATPDNQEWERRSRLSLNEWFIVQYGNNKRKKIQRFCAALRCTQTQLNNSHSHSDSNNPTGGQSEVNPPSTVPISVYDSQQTTCITTYKQTETQTTHDQEVAQYDEYDVVMCVWGFTRIHIESMQQFPPNKVIPEAVK